VRASAGPTAFRTADCIRGVSSPNIRNPATRSQLRVERLCPAAGSGITALVRQSPLGWGSGAPFISYDRVAAMCESLQEPKSRGSASTGVARHCSGIFPASNPNLLMTLRPLRHVVRGPYGRLSTVSDSDLSEDRLYVDLHCSFGQMELACDDFVGRSFL
jgi:hypothetical protein